MAKRKTRYRTRTVYKKARSYSRRSGTKQIIDGALVGVIGKLASNYMGVWGQPLATLGVGMFRNNTTLKTLGGVQLGTIAASYIPFIGGNGGTTTNGSSGVY